MLTTREGLRASVELFQSRPAGSDLDVSKLLTFGQSNNFSAYTRYQPSKRLRHPFHFHPLSPHLRVDKGRMPAPQRLRLSIRTASYGPCSCRS